MASKLEFKVNVDAKSGTAMLKGFESAQQKTVAGMKRQQKAAKGLKGGFSSLQKTLIALGGVMGGSVVLGGLTRMTSGIADLGDSLAKTSTRLGINTDALQKLHFAAERSGVRIETMNMALQRMIRRVGEAGIGTGEAQGAIKELGLDAEKLAKMAPEEMFLKITDAMNQVENSGDRVRLMFKLFDSEGVALKQVMDEGADSIRGMFSEVEALGGIMSGEAIQASVEYKDSMVDMEAAMKGLKVIVGAELIPAFTDLTTLLTQSAAGFAMWIDDISGESKQAQLRAINKELLTLHNKRDDFMTAPQEDWWRDEFKPRMDAAVSDVDQQIQALLDKRNALMGEEAPGEVGGGPGGPGPEAEPGRFLTAGEEQERLLAEQRRVRKDMQAEWDAEDAELDALAKETEIEGQQAHFDMMLAQELAGVGARVKAREDEIKRKKQIEQLALGTTIKMHQATMSIGQAYTAWTGKQSAALFRIEQAAAIGRAVMTTYVAVNEALANPPGPPWTYPIAAAAGIFGMMNVATIAAQKPGGGTVGGVSAPPSVTAQPPGLTPPVTPLVPTTEGEEQRGQLVINIEGDFIGDEIWIDNLVDRINEAGDERDVTIRGDLREYE